jgi:DNA-binding FrmR family transcriptional regulator
MANRRNSALQELITARSLVENAQALLEHDDRCPEILRCLAEAREAVRKSLVILMTECLRRVLDAAQDEQADQRQAALNELLPLVRFSLSALCPSCKHEIGIQLSNWWNAHEQSLPHWAAANDRGNVL